MLPITIFTPTFNRVQLLPRLYDSLKSQTFTHFEWLIVDDGSTDDTEKIVSKFQKDPSLHFSITYVKQANQGKHIAINVGLQKAKGNYFFIVDSDDRLPKNSLKIIHEKTLQIDAMPNVAGVVGLKCYFDGKTVGSHFLKNDLQCSLFDYRYKYKHQGDRAEIIKTIVFQKFLFPKFNTEKFLPESIVWNRMGKNYDFYYFSENVYECEYLEDGLSAKSLVLRRKYPLGVLNLYAELSRINKIGIQFRAKALINFWRFFFVKTYSKTEKNLIPKIPWYGYLLLPLGLIFSILDSLKIPRTNL